MTSINFCFWLQGAIEIANLRSFTDKQVAAIKAHLKLARATKQAAPPAIVAEFMGWLDGALDLYGPGGFTLIKRRLDGVFEHAIDPLHAGEDLDTIHVSKPRC